jgi:NAD(P)-dependent dehydrogenase (short-subunit alcohol dehydrogenase family)
MTDVLNGTLAGKRALVTGAASGIGHATATLFAEHGAHVVGLDREWSESVPGLTCVEGDVTSTADVTDAVAQAAGEDGLDILVANAGVVVTEDWRTSDPEQWACVLDVNVIGVMRCFQAAANNMIERDRKGVLLATASIAAIRAYPALGAYCASKAAVIALVKSAALAFADHGIRVNAVAPGEVDTEMLARAYADEAVIAGTTVEELRARDEVAIPLKRFAQPRDIANAYLLLASEQAGYLTGVTLTCDGGTLLV